MSAAERAAETARNAAIQADVDARLREESRTMKTVIAESIKREKEYVETPHIDPVPPFFDPTVHGDPIFSLGGNGRKIPHPRYQDVNRFYTNTPPGETIPHFYSIYPEHGRLAGANSTKDVLTRAQREPTDATRDAWEHMLRTFIFHTHASSQLAREYLQYYRDAELAVQGFFDDAAERDKPDDDETKVPRSKLTNAAVAAGIEASKGAIAAVHHVMEEDVEAGAFISAPHTDMVLTEKIALFCQCTNQTSALACQYIDMFPGPVQLAIDAFIGHNEEDGTSAHMPAHGAGGRHGVYAAQGGAATNIRTGYVDADGEGTLDAISRRPRQPPATTVTPQVPSEASIAEFQELSGECHRRTAILYLLDYGSPRAAAEAWKLGDDSDDDLEEDPEILNDAPVQAVPVTADRGLVLQFMGTTNADVATTELYLVKFHNNIVDAVDAYCKDKQAMGMDVNAAPKATTL
jgi:hypothetical protein